MNLFKSGVYKKRLYKILLTAGTSILFLLSILLGYNFVLQGQNSYTHYLSNAVSTLESNTRITMMIISRTIGDSLRNPQLTTWANADTKNNYYYSAIAAQKQLQIITTDSSFINYDLSVTTVAPKTYDKESLHLVLKKTGSSSVKKFFLSERGMTQEEMDQVFLHFDQSREPLVFPHYEGNSLVSIYYLTKSNPPAANLLFFVTIPADVLSGTLNANHFLLYEPGHALAYSSNSPDFTAYFDQLLQVLDSKKLDNTMPMKYDGSYVSISSIPFMGWNVAYVNDGFMPPVSQIILFLLIVLVIMGISLYAILKLVETLYRPVKEAVAAALDDFEQQEGSIDEFKLIRQNCEKIQYLGKALNEALQDNNKLASQHYYRAILYSAVADTPCPPSLSLPDTDYRVALIEFMSHDGNDLPNKIMLQKELLREQTVNQASITYVDMDYHCCALILKEMSCEQSLLFLSDLLHCLDEQPDKKSRQRIALSEVIHGVSNLCLAYQEALRILEYKHLYTDSAILTYSQVASVDAVTYSYPLSTENRMVHYILDGNEEALQLFDQLIRTNLLGKTLSIESIQSFVYALIGTVGRIFQELKSSPKDILSEKIDFKYWYDHWSESITITQIRQSLQDTLAAINRKISNNDQVLLDQMLLFIHTNYTDDIMLADLADQFNISPKYCGILFKQLNGSNFKDYLNRYRIEKSKERLEREPDVKITDLSIQVGFNSANSFIRVFRKYTGISPKAYVGQGED